MKHFRGQLLGVSRDTILFCFFKLVDVRAKTLEIIDRHNLFNTLALTLSPQMICSNSATHSHGVTLDSATAEIFSYNREMNSHCQPPAL